MRGWEFYRHMPVYDSTTRLLGKAVEIGHDAEYIHVQQGRVLVTDWYVPMSAVREVTGRGIVLQVRPDELRANRWYVPPEAFLLQQGNVPGYEYTSPGDIPPYGIQPAQANQDGG